MNNPCNSKLTHPCVPRSIGALWLVLLLLSALMLPARASTPPSAIPFAELGARATAGYQGDALGVTATADGARLRCGIQKLEGHATPEGLCLQSTTPGGGQLRLVAVAVGRSASRACQCAPTETASSVRSGMSIVTAPQGDQAPLGATCTQGTATFCGMSLLTELETTFSDVPFYGHAAPDGAIACPGHGTQTLARTGQISVDDKLVRFMRPGLTEEYSVSADGVRQDFVIESRPLNLQPSTLNHSAGALRVELALTGARAEATASGARLTLEGSGRVLAYSRLRVQDATGRELTARLEVLSPDRLAVSVADANATYPVRIDPTFTDADWVSLNPGLPGASGQVFSMAVDGTGNVYVGGRFSVAGTLAANNIAKWDGSAWSALGSGIIGAVSALAVSGTNLYAGGDLYMAGGVTANRIAKWNGNAWSALGSGIDGRVYALAASGTNLYAGGQFATAGGVAANNLAKWDGHAWSALGSGIGPSDGHSSVSELVVSGTNLYAGGQFATAGGVTAYNIAKWDGHAWSALGSGIGPPPGGYWTSTYVQALAVMGANLYAAGIFTNAGGVQANNIARWDGSAWSALGSGIDGSVSALATSGTNLYAGGYFTTAGGVWAIHIAKWDGSAWSALGSRMNGGVSALAASGPNLYVGGAFTTAGGVPANYIARWDGSAWSALGSGMNYRIDALAVSGTDLYAGGWNIIAGSVPANGIAKWDGSTWSALGSGVDGDVFALVVSGTNLYAGGPFTIAGGTTAHYIAKWDGSAWSALGSGMDGYVYALAVSGTTLYAGGNFTTAGGVPANHIAKWDGAAWSALGSGIGRFDSDYVYALAVIGTDLYAGGWFTTPDGVGATNIAKWDGSAWSPLGSGVNGGVDALSVIGTDLYAGGHFATAGGVTAYNIAKWDGHAWSALGSGVDTDVNALAVDGTNLYAGGWFTRAGSVPANRIAKWDGSAWSALGSGMNDLVWALAVGGAGHLFVGGDFSMAGTNVSPYIAEAILLPSAPTISTLPPTQTAEAGGTVTLTVDATGDPPPVYQWYLNGTNRLSCTSSNLLLTNLLFSQSGTYTVVVTNQYGAVTSTPVMLDVIPAVERRPVPGVKVTGEAGSLLNLDYADSLSPAPNWSPLGFVSLTGMPQYYFDLTLPPPPQRFYRAWQTGTPGVIASLDLHLVPAITLTGSMGGKLRVDAINQFGPIDAWFTLDTVTLTNTSELYFDTSAWRQPPRLYRLVQVP